MCEYIDEQRLSIVKKKAKSLFTQKFQTEFGEMQIRIINKAKCMGRVGKWKSQYCSIEDKKIKIHADA